MKDPLLLTYTFEELMYEYHSVREHEIAILEKVEEDSDKIEEEKDKATMDWADQMEADELAAEAAAEAAAAAYPLKNKDNIKWMEEQIARDKEIHGEDFGEDTQIDFD